MRIGAETSGFQKGMASIRDQVNSTARQLDALAKASTAQELPAAISQQVAAFDASDQQRFANLRSRVGSVYTQIDALDAKMQSALAAGQIKEVTNLDRQIAALQRVNQRLEPEFRGMFAANLPVVAQEGEKLGIESVQGFGRGIQRAGVREIASSFGLRLPLGALASGGTFIGGLLLVEEAFKQVQAAFAESDKLAKSLGDLSVQAALDVDQTARLGAAAIAAGVDLGALAKGAEALRGSGLTFDEARAKITAIEDPALRAATAQRLFGDSARALTPLLSNEGAAAGATADQIARLREIQLRQEIAQAAKPPAGTSPLDQAVQFVKDIQAGDDLLKRRAAFQQQYLKEHLAAGASNAEFLKVQAESVTAFEQSTAKQIEEGHAADEAAARLTELTKTETAGTKALAEMAAASDATEAAIGRLTRGFDAADIAALRLPTAMDAATRSAFDALSTAGVLGPETQKALDIAVKLHLDPATTSDVLKDFENISDLSASSISGAIGDRLRKELADDFSAARLEPLLRAQEEELSIQDRIAEIQQSMDDRHRKALLDGEKFSKSELDAQTRARSEEKAFFAFRDTSGTARAALQDKHDADEIAKLQKQLADISVLHPDLTAEIAAAQSTEKTLKLEVSVDLNASSDDALHEMRLTRQDAIGMLEGVFAKVADEARSIIRSAGSETLSAGRSGPY